MTFWNSFDTAGSDGMTAAVIKIKGANGDEIHAYTARPEGRGPFPGVVLVHHMPGWDELYREFTRRFAQHGYNTICPDLYCRAGHGKPDDVSAEWDLPTLQTIGVARPVPALVVVPDDRQYGPRQPERR